MAVPEPSVDWAGTPIPDPIPSVSPSSNGHPDDLTALIAAAVAPFVKAPTATLDENRVRAIVQEQWEQASHGTSEEDVRRIVEAALAAAGALRVVVSVKDSSAPAVDVGRQHRDFPTLLHFVGRRKHVFLVGPSGSGKTTTGHAVADALALPFYSMSVGPQTTKSDIFGYPNIGNSTYVRSLFREAYEHGGVFLLDELDAGNPGVLTALNQAIGNGSCAFPDGMVKRHPDFVLIAAGNTYGNGASREYVGRLQLDGATKDRFAVLDWHYDEQLETDLATAAFQAAGGTDPDILKAWLAKVRYARERAAAHNIRHIVSPRASIDGADLLGSGMAEPIVADTMLWKGLDEQSKRMMS